MSPTGSDDGPPVAPETVLGVHPGATVREIDVAWRAYVKAHHPDRGGDSETFLRGRSARDTLLERGGSANATLRSVPPRNGPVPRGVPARRRMWVRRVRASLATVFPSLAPPPSRVD